MAFHHSPRTTGGTIFAMDATNKKCYPGSGTTLTDMNNNQTITLTGGPTIQTVNGTKVIDLDGSNDYITTSSTPAYPSVNFSVEIWAKFDSLNGASNLVQYIFQMGPLSNGDGGCLAFAKYDQAHSGNNRLYFHFGSSHTGGATLFGKIEDLNWHHYVATIQGTTVKLYVDSDLRGTHTAPANITPTGRYDVGRYIDSNGYFFNGQISINKFYNKTLTAAEVLLNYNSMKVRFE
jgi:hypothetical protein